ncbi:MAG: OmpA family protein [Burkholderiales bacterium]|nr:OmpA family protein [Burkholderiales bacterium]
MNKFVKIFAASAVIAFSVSANAQTANATKSAYLQDGRGAIAKNTFGLCYRASYWTPADAVAGCDGSIAKVEAPKAGAAPAPKAAPKPAPQIEKVSFASDTLFDFNKATLKPEGQEALDDLFLKLFGMKLEVIVTTGHTDSIGNDAYNQKLSLKRAEAVKAYLVEKGVEENRVYVEGKGESAPKVTCKEKNRQKQIACEAPNRRVDIEVVGTRTK